MSTINLLFAILLFLTSPVFAQPVTTNPPLNFEESDGSPSTYPYKVIVGHTDNGNGTITITTASSLTGLSDVGSADTTIGNILVADGTDFQSVRVPMSVRTDSNNVGIGITAPSAKLHVSVDDSGGVIINADTTGIGGIDSNTDLMLHMDGADGSTTFTDSSQNAFVGSPVGQTQIDTAQSKFGGASGLFDGTGDTLDYADNDAWQLGGGNGNWTIDLWFRTTDATLNQGFFQQRVDTNNFYQFNWGGSGNFRYSYKEAGVQENYDFNPATVLSNTWYHLALVRYNNNMYLFLDGVQVGSALALSTTSQANFAATFTIGTLNGLDWNGWMDEFRLSDTARYTGNFTPATSAYTLSGGGQPTLKFQSNDVTGWTVGEDGSSTGGDSFRIGTPELGDTKLTINTSGNVGIGTTNPVKTLQVAGSARITGLSACSAVSTNFSGDLTCGTAGATSLTGLSDVGVATATAGNILIADGTKFQSTSLSGDATLSSAGSLQLGSAVVGPTELASTAVTAGTYSSSAITVDQDGRITNAASGSLTGLTDIGVVTKTAGNLLIADGTKFQSVALSGDATLSSAGSLQVTESALDHNSLANLTVGDVHTQYAYLAGRSGGQTLVGGTASGDDLILQSTSDSTRGMVNIERTARIHTATSVTDTVGGNYNVIDVPLSLTLSGASPSFRTLLTSGTVTYTVDPNTLGSGALLNFNTTIATTGNRTMSALTGFANNAVLSPSIVGTTTGFSIRSFFSNPTFSTLIGTAASPFYRGLNMAGIFNTGWTVTDWQGMYMTDPTGSGGTITNMIGVDIDALTGRSSTLIAGIRSAIAAGTGKYFLRDTGGAQSVIKGKVAVGTTTDPTESLNITGNASASGSMAAGSFTATTQMGASSFTGGDVYATNPTINQALCFNAAHKLSICTSAVGAGGGCTCP